MLYKSTRGESPEVPFSEVLLGGLAPDGGLYMPEHFPKYKIDEIKSWSNLSFEEVAHNVLYPYVRGEIAEDVFADLLNDAYKDFDSSDVVELKEIEKNHWILELFHGPTLAFKDIAMQLLGSLLNHFAEAVSYTHLTLPTIYSV